MSNILGKEVGPVSLEELIENQALSVGSEGGGDGLLGESLAAGLFWSLSSG